jgi:hypothetical protein
VQNNSSAAVASGAIKRGIGRHKEKKRKKEVTYAFSVFSAFGALNR